MMNDYMKFGMLAAVIAVLMLCMGLVAAGPGMASIDKTVPIDPIKKPVLEGMGITDPTVTVECDSIKGMCKVSIVQKKVITETKVVDMSTPGIPEEGGTDKSVTVEEKTTIASGVNIHDEYLNVSKAKDKAAADSMIAAWVKARLEAMADNELEQQANEKFEPDSGEVWDATLTASAPKI